MIDGDHNSKKIHLYVKAWNSHNIVHAVCDMNENCHSYSNLVDKTFFELGRKEINVTIIALIQK